MDHEQLDALIEAAGIDVVRFERELPSFVKVLGLGPGSPDSSILSDAPLGVESCSPQQNQSLRIYTPASEFLPTI